MKNNFSKSILLVFMFLGMSLTVLEANDIIINGGIKIELKAGFTIEDIIQDLHDNANITDITTYGSVSTYVIEFDPKFVDEEILIGYLLSHKGINKVKID
jgi:hypothetical protein